MKVAGIIAEYNPFHSGHRFHIEETRRLSGVDYVVVVMSGDFVQRGEPAMVDKYLRTQMALEGGADLVIEMPAIYATASAEYFATAGVELLDRLGCVDYISFGSEWAGLELLEELADILIEEPDLYKEYLKKNLEAGKNFPQAREEAMVAYTGKEEFGRILESPNHILGIEYMKALKRKASSMQAIVIRREGSAYHEESWNGSMSQYPSATALRNILKKKTLEEEDFKSLKAGIPCAFQELMTMMEQEDYVTWEDLMPLLDYTFLLKENVLGKYFGMDYDLSQRISRLYKQSHSFEELIALCHSKNYTDAALRRIFLHLLLHFKEQPFLREGAKIPLPYLRVLGLRKEAGKILSLVREQGEIAVIQRPVEGKEAFKKNMVANIIYQYDMRSSNLYEQIASRKAQRDYRIEYIRNPIIL